ncbi:MAG TPA: HD domain-containing phosphohydrolase, partial [Polyangiaceae bacterium]|nr:HD domain-containing phosphohydrolase [Polyangiaceae bacterium]
MTGKPRVLCVDDEPNVLEGLTLSLRRNYQVVVADSGRAGLEALAKDTAMSAVISDMRMPGMDGAVFLSKARALAPDTTRLLLTGHSELDAAIAAVNEGRIFRFLTKPCPPPVLVAAVDAAVEQHRLVTSERVLLEQTLRGSIRMLSEVLALSAPSVFGQAMRIQRYARDLAARTPEAQTWPIEIAALLSRVGCISLPAAMVEKLQDGGPLNAEEQQALDRLPALAEQFIATIPRLDQVRAALKYQTVPFDGSGAPASAPKGKDLPVGARILAIACEFDRLEAAGVAPQLALDTMRGRRGRYDPDLLELFASVVGTHTREAEIAEIPIRLVRAGMTFVDDVRTPTGALLVSRGHEATPSLLERFRNFAPGAVREP